MAIEDISIDMTNAKTNREKKMISRMHIFYYFLYYKFNIQILSRIDSSRLFDLYLLAGGKARVRVYLLPTDS